VILFVLYIAIQRVLQLYFLLIRPAFWSALPLRLPSCLGAIVPELFPDFSG